VIKAIKPDSPPWEDDELFRKLFKQNRLKGGVERLLIESAAEKVRRLNNADNSRFSWL